MSDVPLTVWPCKVHIEHAGSCLKTLCEKPERLRSDLLRMLQRGGASCDTCWTADCRPALTDPTPFDWICCSGIAASVRRRLGPGRGWAVALSTDKQ